ncbi:MAG: DUF4082 domain-containing protein [Chloroflexi bacterium]|nr:DUF4082 domain-containing protein [Chloroflexota bacterium]
MPVWRTGNNLYTILGGTGQQFSGVANTANAQFGLLAPSRLPTRLVGPVPRPAAFPVAATVLANETIWPNTQTGDEYGGVEGTFGTRFTVDVAGQITHLRFYETASQDGTVGLKLWEMTSATAGTELASTSYDASATGVSGWRNVAIAPVTVSPGVQYMVSYHIASGNYIAIVDYFATNPRVSGNLTAPAHNVNPTGYPQGTYHSEAALHTIPVTGYGHSYFADVVFGTESTLTQVGSDLDARWNTRAAVAALLDSRWNIQTLVAGSLEARWAVRTVADRSLDARWNVRSVAGSSLDTRWADRAVAGSALDVRWDDRAAVGRALDARWDTRAVVIRSLDARWNVRAAIGSGLDARWAVRSAIAQSLDARWAVRGLAGSSLDARWNVASSLLVVGSSLEARWAVRALATSPLDARWNVRSPVGQSLDARWAVRTAVGRSLDARWAVRALAFVVLDVRWNVRAVVVVSLDARWGVRVLVPSALDARWNVAGSGPAIVDPYPARLSYSEVAGVSYRERANITRR